MGVAACDPVSLSTADSALLNVPIKSMAHEVEPFISCILYCKESRKIQKVGEKLPFWAVEEINTIL